MFSWKFGCMHVTGVCLIWLQIKPNYRFCFLLQQERRSQQPTPALHVSSPMAAPGSCCSMLRTPMDFVSTWKVNTAALSPRGWVDPPPLVGVQTALLSRLFMASICLLMQALSTFFASRAQAQVEGTVLGQWEGLVLVVVLLGCIISVSLPPHPSSAPLQGTTWTTTIWAQKSWRWQPTIRVPLTGWCASILLCP